MRVLQVLKISNHFDPFFHVFTVVFTLNSGEFDVVVGNGDIT